MPMAVPQTKTDISFDRSTIVECSRYVCSMQRKLDKAVANNDKKKIRQFTYLLLKRSRALRILAVHSVTIENEGKYTPGVDGVRIKKGHTAEVKALNSTVRTKLLMEANIKKNPSPIRRTHIRKPNGKMRPLGILTLQDRVIQDMVRMAIEPITEFYANDRSYGFRPKRSCHDAIRHLFQKLSRRNCKQWIIEGDIQGCFDHIKHEHIIKMLEKWNTPEYVRTTIEQMLKAKVFEHETLIDPDTGTPQGGILSPMLANVALTTLDNFCERYGKGNEKNPILRYADDFVITCNTKEEAEKIKDEIAEMLHQEIGLTLSLEKTEITHISEGFNFIGFNLRKYTERSPRSKYHKVGKLLIKPQKEKVRNHLRKIKKILSRNKTAKQDSIIHMINPILQGFAMYYRFVISQKIFSKIMHDLWYKLWRWAKRRHPNKPRPWVMKKYFTTHGRKWMFQSEDGNDTIVDIAKIPLVRFVKVRRGIRVHGGDKETIEYWKQREYTNALKQIYSVKRETLYKRQKGLCSYCEQAITKEEIKSNAVHVHHMNPRTQGGTDRLNNLSLLHLSCHKEAHSIMTREQMSYWIKLSGNYIRKPNIRAFAEKEMSGGKDKVAEVEKEIKSQKIQRVLERKRKASLKRVALILQEGHI